MWLRMALPTIVLTPISPVLTWLDQDLVSAATLILEDFRFGERINQVLPHLLTDISPQILECLFL